MPFPTIHEILSRQLLVVTPSDNVSHHTRGNVWITPADVSHWTGFTLQNIMAAYGDILGCTETASPQAGNNFRIRALDNVKEMDANFFHHLLPRSLEVGRQCLAQRLGNNADLITFSRARRVGAACPPVTIRSGDQPLVLGAMRPRADWSSQDPQSTQLFDQLLGYANQGRSRYGFAVTDAEFVVTQAYPHWSGMAIRCHAIPIGASGTDELTPALALWCLAMMALNQHHRHPATHSYPFNTWYVDARENGQVTYMHHLSRAVRATMPPLEGLRLLEDHLRPSFPSLSA